MPSRWLFNFFQKIRVGRDERRWEEWEALLADQRKNGGWIGEVTSIRHNTQTGTKAYVRRLGMQDVEAVWVPDRRLATRTFFHAVYVSRRPGTYGSHHGGEFLWIITVGRIARRGVYTGWLRHKARLPEDVRAEEVLSAFAPAGKT